MDNGDPETPFYPSIDGVYRWTRLEIYFIPDSLQKTFLREKVDKYGAKYDLPGLPNIPITPIGYNDAEKLLVAIGGDKAPQDLGWALPSSGGPPPTLLLPRVFYHFAHPSSGLARWNQG